MNMASTLSWIMRQRFSSSPILAMIIETVSG